MARKHFISAIAALSLMACNERPITGYCVGKRFVAAHTERYYTTMPRVPHTRHIPDRYIIWVADSTGSRPVLVDKRTFEATKHGEYVRLRREGSAEADEE